MNRFPTANLTWVTKLFRFLSKHENSKGKNRATFAIRAFSASHVNISLRTESVVVIVEWMKCSRMIESSQKSWKFLRTTVNTFTLNFSLFHWNSFYKKIFDERRNCWGVCLFSWLFPSKIITKSQFRLTTLDRIMTKETTTNFSRARCRITHRERKIISNLRNYLNNQKRSFFCINGFKFLFLAWL